MKKTIGILGGMGPLATADLYRKITLLTDADQDSGHIHIYIDSHTAIPDRTAAILHQGTDPVPFMADSIRKLEQCGADCLIMPCNTAHCFLPRLQLLTSLPFLSMLEAAAKTCRTRFPGGRAGILATEGAIQSGLYQEALNREGIPYLLPDHAEQDALMRVIYEGVKAGRPQSAYRADWVRVTGGMRSRGADFFILGCTELPVAAEEAGLDAPSVDPTVELAKAAIRFCGYRVRGE